MTISFRHSMVAAAILALGAVSAAAAPKGRVVILGFDGVDPGIVSEMWSKEELPNLAKLQKQGGFSKLKSSNPPQSPSAWSNFATCRTVFNHGIYDFLRRDPKQYMPGVGFGMVKRPELAPDGALSTPAAFVNYRRGETFWKVASDQGLKVKALVVPFAYPVDDLHEECRQLAGLDVRDIRGTQSTYFAFAEDFPKDLQNVPGGIRMKLRFENSSATVKVPGLRMLTDRRKFAEAPLRFAVDRAAKKLGITVGERSVVLAEGEWSPWIEWEFQPASQYAVRAISRFYAMEAGDKVRVYMSCLQYDPREPMIPISSPDSYAGELVERYGLYKTIGWAFDTKALEKDDMNADMFLEDVGNTMAWREQLCLDELDRGDFDLLCAAWTGTDRVSHMFWRYRDPLHPMYTEDGAKKYGQAIEDTYRRMDVTVGKVMDRLDENGLLMVMSDHGFHSARRNFSVNTWLIRNGYLAVRQQSDPATAYTDKKYLDLPTKEYPRLPDKRGYYDWSKTQAYGLGLGMIFLNRQGREKEGAVTEAQAPALLEEIRTKLLAATDPETGDKVFSNVYVHGMPKGEAAEEAPDIQLGYADGYQTDKASAAGAAPEKVFSDNLSKWSGEHASSDTAITPGIFFSNKALNASPALTDIGVTALTYLKAKAPDKAEGHSLLP
jgi:predicted AlkP superfamily phosphohydrolase/phosphomutase